MVLVLIWDWSGLLRKAQRGRALEEERCVVVEMELVTAIGRSKVV